MKKLIKKAVSAVLTVAVLSCVFGLYNPACLTAYAGGDIDVTLYESGIFIYELDGDNNNTAYIDGITDFSVTSIDFPRTIDGYTVSGINGGFSDYLLSKCAQLKSVTIPDSYTKIGYMAFEGCKGLTSITIPNSVTRIGSYAFLNCTGLTSINIPNSVTSIGSSAFSGCSGLTGITIPDSVTSIGSSAFSGCSGLTSINIPDGVTKIDFSAFHGCNGLTSINIPGSVTSIGSYAFCSCTGLKSVTIPESVTKIDEMAFYACRGLTDVYYAGSPAQKEKIEIASKNDNLLNAKWHYASGNGVNNALSPIILLITRINWLNVMSLLVKTVTRFLQFIIIVFS